MTQFKKRSSVTLLLNTLEMKHRLNYLINLVIKNDHLSDLNKTIN